MKRTPSANSGFGRRLSMAASRSGDLGAMVSSRIGRRSSLTHAPAVIGDGLDDEGSGHNSSNNNNEPYSSSPMVIDSPTKLSSSSSAAPNEKENEPYFSDDDDEYDDSALQNILKEIPNVSRSSNELNLEPPVPPAPAPAQQPSSPPGKAMRRGSAFAGMGMGGSFRSASGGSKKEEDVLAMMATEAHSVATGVCPVEYCVSESKPVVRIKSDENNEPSYLELNIFLRPKRLKRENQRSHFRIGKKSGSGTSTEKRGVGVC